MKYAAKTLFGLTILALVLGLAACGDSDGANNTNSDDSLVLRTYTVPDRRAEDLMRTLNQAFGGDRQIGRASVAGSGRILVLAPKHMQDSIAASIKQIVGNGSSHAAKGPESYRLNAWIVDAWPGQGPPDPSLKAIPPALGSFSKATGPAHFVEAHYLTAVSDVGAQVKLIPLVATNFSYTLTRSDGSFALKFSYRQSPVSKGPGVVGLQGQVTVRPGQTLVLGLISDRPAEPSGARSEADHSTNTPVNKAENAAQGAGQNAGAVHRLLVVRVTSANQG